MAGKKTGQGSEKRQREAVVQYRTTVERAAALRAAADARGISLAAYLRERDEGAPGPRSRSSRLNPDRAALALLRTELGHHGGNLNQLAYLANIGDLDRPRELDTVITELRQTYALVTKAMGLKP